MRIGIDLDGVCYPFVDVFRAYVEAKYATTYGPIECWDFHKTWGFTTPEFLALMEEACTTGPLFYHGNPIPGSVETVGHLKYDLGHDIVICTTRGDYAHHATHTWVNKWRIPYDELVITDDKTSCGLDVLLDDGPHNIEAVRSAGCRGIVFDQPWNRHVDGDRITAWDQLVGVL